MMNPMMSQMPFLSFHGGSSIMLTTSPKRSAHKTKLPPDFVPGAYTVICGRGKLCSASPGNQHLRSLVNSYLEQYSMAKNKAEKSSIVSAIVDRVREASPVGAFIKQETNGEWWEVDDSFAREKIGCIFRDILHGQYRSSTKAKHARKKAQEGREDSSSPTKKKTNNGSNSAAECSRGSTRVKHEVDLNSRLNSTYTYLYFQNAAPLVAKKNILPSSLNSTTPENLPYLSQADLAPCDSILLAQRVTAHYNTGQRMTAKQEPAEEQPHHQDRSKSNLAMMSYGGGLRRPRLDYVVQKHQDDSLSRRGGLMQLDSSTDEIRRKAHSLLHDVVSIVQGKTGCTDRTEDIPDDLSGIFDD